MTRITTTSGRDAPPPGAADLEARWRRTAECWRLTRSEAAALLRVRRADMVGTAVRPDVTTPTGRMTEIVELAEALLLATGSPALASRWIRFPSLTKPDARRLDMIIASDDFLRAASDILRRRNP